MHPVSSSSRAARARPARSLIPALALCVLSHACAGAPAREGAAAAAPLDAELALATFDSVWSRIAHTHYDTAFGGVDWAGVRAELRPAAAAVRTLPDLRRVIGDMLSRLGESHYGLIPGEVVDAADGSDAAVEAISGDVGAELRIVGGDLLVWRLRADGAAARAGVGTGWQLTHIDGRATADRIRAIGSMPESQRRTALTRLLYQSNAELAGAAGSTVELRLRDGAGRAAARTLTRQPRAGEVVRFGNLPPSMAQLHQERLPAGSGCVGLIRFNIWLAPLAGQIDRAVEAVRSCQGIIIDLRGNPGGVAAMVMGTAGHFLNDTLPLGFLRTRTSELRFKANPRRVRVDGSAVAPYAGPLAILTDEMTASTSEFFAAGLQGVGRARVFGSPSAGQALPAMTVRLPTGDVLMHVMGDFTGPHAVRIEGRGVIPDVVVASTRTDLLEGRDMPLLAAQAWITGGAAAGQHRGGDS
ncbi:MAG TPA: S41 family peptidase [Longimicrobiales bacterium]|nr:S41 family peptidase [Longimicrobiales bacterium]